MSIKDHLERAGRQDTTTAPKAQNTLVGSNYLSLENMKKAAQDLGLQTTIEIDNLTGDVGEAADSIVAYIAEVSEPTALLFGGETTVKLSGTGLGGRNQELALRVAMQAPKLSQDWVFLSGGTDGRDGPTDAAGGIVDAGTIDRITSSGSDAKALLANNDSYAALKIAGDLLITQATGTNVADVQVLLITP
jgi:hydroxypyruvate reductase